MRAFEKYTPFGTELRRPLCVVGGPGIPVHFHLPYINLITFTLPHSNPLLF
jgi:hypothetical protein